MLSACTATPAVVTESKPEVKVELLTEKSEDDNVLHSRFLNMLNQTNTIKYHLIMHIKNN